MRYKEWRAVLHTLGLPASAHSTHTSRVGGDKLISDKLEAGVPHQNAFAFDW